MVLHILTQHPLRRFQSFDAIVNDKQLLAINLFWVLFIPVWRDIHFCKYWVNNMGVCGSALLHGRVWQCLNAVTSDAVCTHARVAREERVRA